MFQYAELVVCVRCGSYSSQQQCMLAKACTGRYVAGGRRVLHNIARGRHPQTRKPFDATPVALGEALFVAQLADLKAHGWAQGLDAEFFPIAPERRVRQE